MEIKTVDHLDIENLVLKFFHESADFNLDNFNMIEKCLRAQILFN